MSIFIVHIKIDDCSKKQKKKKLLLFFIPASLFSYSSIAFLSAVIKLHEKNFQHVKISSTCFYFRVTFLHRYFTI